MPNSAKSQASNITPKKHSANRLRCQREKGSRSSRPTSSADFFAVVAMSPLPGGTLILVSMYSAQAREVNNEADQNDKRRGSIVPSPLEGEGQGGGCRLRMSPLPPPSPALPHK